MTPTRAPVSAIFRCLTWSKRLRSATWPLRELSTSPARYRGRDVLAKYRPRPPAPLVTARDHLDLASGSKALSDDFVTSSTQPVGTSFQTVPPPASDAAQHGTYQRAPVPAMLPSADSTSTSASGPASEPAQRRKEMIVQGVPIPPKPIPPGEEGKSVERPWSSLSALCQPCMLELTPDCCMSGCVHCVYTIYADDLELYTGALESARRALTNARVPTSQWPDEVQTKSSAARDVRDAEVKKVEESVDPSMAAFLAWVSFRLVWHCGLLTDRLEAKMRKKQVA